MQGSIRKKRDKWSYRIDVGYIGGQRKQIERGGFLTKKEATVAMNEAIYKLNQTGEYVENKKISFADVFNEFIETEAKATRAYATIKRYKSLYENHFKQAFGAYYMYRISANMIEDFFNLKKKSYSEEYVKGFYKLLTVIFRYAKKKNYTKKNVMQEVTAPPDPRHVEDLYIYTQEQLDAMTTRLQGTNVIISYYIALNTGLRESEVFALQWQDIDLEKNTIKVCKQLLFQDRKWCFCPLKTVNSYRTVNITQQFANYLKSLKAQQDAERELYGDGWKRNYVTDRLKTNKETLLKIEDFVNIKQNGEMLTSNSVKFLSRVIKQDLGFQFKFHNLRHTFASVLAENGVNPKYVQKTLGHSKMEFTLKYYTHVTEKMTEKAIAAIDTSLSLAYAN